MTPVLNITEQERAERAEHRRAALAHLRLEGLELAGEELALFQRYVDGELGLTELGAAMRALNERDFGSLHLPRNGRS